MQRVDLTGNKYGKLTVLEYLGDKKYKCVCECGDIKEVATYSLTSGKVASCGCDSTRQKYDIKGKKFGKLLVKSYNNDGTWSCLCDCGNTVDVLTNRLIFGQRTTCGKCSKREDRTNYIGLKYGDWTVIGEDKEDPNKLVCRCICGTVKSVEIYNLKSGASKSCGHATNKFKDLTGQKFGKLTVLSYTENKLWECQCECGSIKEYRAHDLLSGNTKSCGHATNSFQDITGKNIGKWAVLKYIGNGKYECRCQCGNTKEVDGYSLRYGNSLSCGRCNSVNKDTQEKVKREAQDLTGGHFGEWEVLSKDASKSRHYICKCSCGKTKSVHEYSLTNGSSKSCGHSKFLDNTIEYKKKTLLERYGEVATNKINNPREKWQIDVVSSQESLKNYLETFEIKPNTNELSQLLSINRPALLRMIHSYGLEQYIDLYEFASSGEKEIADYIKSIYPLSIERNTKSVIPPHELDIYLPDKKVAIEFNGNYWHSELVKDKNYHLRKTMQCFRNGIHLIHIFEYEWNNEKTRNLLKEYIKSLLCQNSKIGARVCELKKVDKDDAIEFLNRYHLQGYANSDYNYGLYYRGELISVMTFGKPRFNKDCEYELIRYAVKPGFRIIGGQSKLFDAFVDEYNPSSIVSYCDISKFTGEVYLKLLFKAVNINSVKPNYKWFSNNSNEVLSRYSTMKHKISDGNDPRSESDIMHELGYWKIYDCGNVTLVWTKE